MTKAPTEARASIAPAAPVVTADPPAPTSGPEVVLVEDDEEVATGDATMGALGGATSGEADASAMAPGHGIGMLESWIGTCLAPWLSSF